MWQVGKPPAGASRTPPPAGRGGPRMPSRQVLLGGAAAVVVVFALIRRRNATGSSNGANTAGGNPSTPMVVGPNGQGTYDSSGQDTANALLDINTRLSGIGSTLDALDPAKWPGNVGASVGPSGVPAPGGTAPVPGSGVAAATPPAPAGGTAPATLPWHKPAPLAATPRPRPLTKAKPSTRALSTFDAASRARLAAGKAVTGGDGRTMKLVSGVPTTVSYKRVAPKPAPPAPRHVTLPPRRRA